MASEIKKEKKVKFKNVKDIKKFLTQYAFGYVLIDKVSEYSTEPDGSMKLIKQKIAEKNVPPDLALIKLLYDFDKDRKTDFENLTDEQLQAEKQRLLKILEQK